MVVHQHHHITAIVQAVQSTRETLRQESFDQLRQYLAAHETVEQRFLHGVARGPFDENRGIVEARVQEENAIAEVISRLKRFPTASIEFVSLFNTLSDLLHTHMSVEESHELPVAARGINPEQADEITRALER